MLIENKSKGKSVVLLGRFIMITSCAIFLFIIVFSSPLDILINSGAIWILFLSGILLGLGISKVGKIIWWYWND